jgi:hypothetical protein
MWVKTMTVRQNRITIRSVRPASIPILFGLASKAVSGHDRMLGGASGGQKVNLPRSDVPEYGRCGARETQA